MSQLSDRVTGRIALLIVGIEERILRFKMGLMPSLVCL